MGGGLMKGAFGGIIILFIVMMFIVNMTPQLEENVSSANISNSMTGTMIDMAPWVIPVLCIAGVFMAALGLFGLAGGRAGISRRFRRRR